MIFTDITDKVRAENALAEQQHALADANAHAEKQQSYLADLTHRLDQASASVDSAKTTLLRTMGHELKTPLNAILGFSDLMATLADNMSPTRSANMPGWCIRAATTCSRSSTRSWTSPRSRRAAMTCAWRRWMPAACLWMMREVFMPRAAARGIEINADRCPVGLMVHADEAVFTAMIHALLDNAVTFTTGNRITLSVCAAEAGVCVTVEDNGDGVAAEDLARILEPFEHAGRGEGTGHAKGAGLGLTLIKAFAELHGGAPGTGQPPGRRLSRQAGAAAAPGRLSGRSQDFARRPLRSAGHAPAAISPD